MEGLLSTRPTPSGYRTALATPGLLIIIQKSTLLVLLSPLSVFPGAATADFSIGPIQTRIDLFTGQY